MLATAFRSCRLLSYRVFQHFQRGQQFSTTVRLASAGLSLNYQDDIAVIKMDKGENRINMGFIEEYNALLDAVEKNPEPRALVSIGEGKFYSLGLDLAWLVQQSDETVLLFMRQFHNLMLRVLLFPVPTMAAMNGHAFAGGCILATAHDLRTMNSDKGWMCLNEVLLNIPFAEFLMSVARTTVGSAQTASDVILLGKRFTASQALEHRMIHAAYPAASLLEDSLKFLNTAVDKNGIAREALQRTKRSYYKDSIKEYEIANGPGFETSEFAQNLLAGIKRQREPKA